MVARLNDQQGLRECHLLTSEAPSAAGILGAVPQPGPKRLGRGTPGLRPAPVGVRPGPHPRRRGRPGRLPPPAGDPLAPTGPPPGRPGPGRPAPPLSPTARAASWRSPGPWPSANSAVPGSPAPRTSSPGSKGSKPPRRAPWCSRSSSSACARKGCWTTPPRRSIPRKPDPCGAHAYRRRPAFSTWRAAARRPGPPRPPGRTSSPGTGANSPAKTPFSRNWCATP